MWDCFLITNVETSSSLRSSSAMSYSYDLQQHTDEWWLFIHLHTSAPIFFSRFFFEGILIHTQKRNWEIFHTPFSLKKFLPRGGVGNENFWAEKIEKSSCQGHRIFRSFLHSYFSFSLSITFFLRKKLDRV